MDNQYNKLNESSRGLQLPGHVTPEPFSEPSTSVDLRDILRTIWRRRGTVAAVFLIVFLGVAFGTYLQDPVYRATAVLEIRRDTADAVAPETLFNLMPVWDEHMRTEIGILTSTALAERVIGELNLAESDEFKSARWKQWLGRTDPPKAQALAEKFKSLLFVSTIPDSWLVQVSFDALDPDRAARIVNAVLSNYVKLRVESGDKATAWLEAQLRATEVKLKNSEDRLHEYVRTNDLQLLESDQGNGDNLITNRLRQLQEALTEAESARYAKESEVTGLQDVKAIKSLDNAVVEKLSVQLAEQKREYARLMSSFLPEYPKAKEVRNQIDELETQLQLERERHGHKLSNEYKTAVKREKMLRQAVDEQQAQAYRIAAKASGYNTIKREVETNKQLYSVLQQKLKEVGVSNALKATHVGIVDQAHAPASPDRPKPMVNLALGMSLGLMLGIGVALLRGHLDTRMHTIDEVGASLGLPALGLIPSASSVGNQRRIVSGDDAGSPDGLVPTSWYRIDRDLQQASVLPNAFAALRTSVLFRGAETAPRSLLITSSRPGEGKTTVSVNLALSLARLGRRVLLIDGDVRRPCIHRVFALRNKSGLTTFLSGDQENWTQHVRKLEPESISVLPSGPPSADSAELLSSTRLNRLMAEAVETYDFVIVDAPALFLNIADARILSEAVDGSVFVVRSGSTDREIAMRAVEQARNVIGVVINDVKMGILPGYYREYYQPYQERPDTGTRRLSN